MGKKEDIKERAILLFDEINRLSADIISFTRTEKEASEMFEDILVDMYIEGFSAAAYTLNEENAKTDITKIKRAVNFTYPDDDSDIIQKFRRYYRENKAQDVDTLIHSETHRVLNTAGFDLASIVPGAKAEWITMRDTKVRDTHYYLDGIKTPVGGYFYTFDGDMARFPGDFQKASNNANCRCIIKWDR